MGENLGVLFGLEAALQGRPEVTDEFLELAAKVSEQSGEKLGVEKLLDLATTMVNLVGYFQDPKVRWALTRADNHPGGVVAFFVRRKVRASLPEAVGTDDAAKLVVGFAAAIVERT